VNAPCKRPKVTVDVVYDALGAVAAPLSHRVICHVPRCTWTYGPAVKSDAGEQATWHRQQHRAGVPKTRIERDLLHDVYCEPCGGHRRTFGSRREASEWLDEHLATEHGAVVCP
jgi:hypothetical protein